jgi:uncharacterized protein DUF4175
VSPETAVSDFGAEQVFTTAIAAAVRRARVLALAEALGWGLAAGAISPVAGGLIAASVAAWRWKSTSRASIVGRLEHAHPDAANLYVTADELTRAVLVAKPSIRARVLADAAASTQQLDLGAAFPIRRLVSLALMAALIWTVVVTTHFWRGAPSAVGPAVVSRSASNTPAGVRLHVSAVLQPPSYTGLKETTALDPEQLQAIEGSVVVLSIDASADRVTVEHDGRRRSLARGAGGRFTDRLQATRTGFLAVTTDEGARRTIPIVVSPDALPAVRLTAPGRDLVFSGGNPRIAFDARATDDFGLRSLLLRYTKVTGSGENYEFREGEIPMTLEAANARDWAGSVSRTLAELGLKEGDMLVYRAVAADARPGDGSAASDAFIIEISKLGAAAGDAFTLPQEESKYALSQQMLIVKTERLHRRRASLASDDLAEQSLNLAVEQRMIRAEFVFMLGGEINDEEVEAEQSVELQAGRLQNRGQRDLRTATIAMSQAEKWLTGANTAEALIAERAAVAALQRAFSRDRYILRALATRSQLDPARRLTGSLGDATGWHRVPPDAPANRRAALLQDLLRGIAELSVPGPKGPGLQTDVRAADPSGPVDSASDARRAGPFGPADAAPFRQRALLVVDEAIRIDPASASLRQAATELQRAADATDPGARSSALAAAATAAAAEARRAHADAPLASPAVAPALGGAFADAMHARLPAPSPAEGKGSRSIEKAPR